MKSLTIAPPFCCGIGLVLASDTWVEVKFAYEALWDVWKLPSQSPIGVDCPSAPQWWHYLTGEALCENLMVYFPIRLAHIFVFVGSEYE